LDEKQLFSLFADNLRERREYCKLSLVQLSALVDIPNQTLSSYENKTHVPSMMQAVKIAAFFHLTVEEFIVCGLDEYPFDITELYERKKND
jgi:DNA-binding XRE family transcriptional regulator